ncbi:MAG: LysR family glycine cleavage system transcriptional activator [Colwellia sp.]
MLVQTALNQEWLKKHPNGESLEGLTYYMLVTESRENSRKVALFREWLLNELIKDAIQ